MALFEQPSVGGLLGCISDLCYTAYRYTHLPHQKHIHTRSCWSLYINDSLAINSIWSTTRCPRSNSGRKVVFGAPANLTRSANASGISDRSDVNIRLFNICSVTDKGLNLRYLFPYPKLDFLCLTDIAATKLLFSA